MTIELSYGGELLSIDIPDGVEVDQFAPAEITTPFDFASFEREFTNAGGREFVAAGLPLVVVNDAYRNTPTETILEWLGHIEPHLIDEAPYIIATGTHAAPSEDQLASIFGPSLDRIRPRLTIHDAENYDSMVKLGIDSLGGDVWLNEAVIDRDRLLCISSVEPHYFAGFTGGRKSIFPGLTDLATIERNHNLANSLEAAPLKLVGNPVAEHLDALMQFIDPSRLFGVQVVPAAGGGLASVCMGGLGEAFTRAAERAERVFAHEIDQQYDVVLCELLSPLDKNLYQVQKALENCHEAVRNGGAIVLLSACEEGVGSQHFLNLAATWDRAQNRPVDGRLRFGSHKLSRVNAHSQRIDVLLHSRLPSEVVRRVYYEPLDFVKKFLYLRSDQRELFRLAVVRDAGNSVLRV
jgi:nickel-dependent lactate racemase